MSSDVRTQLHGSVNRLLSDGVIADQTHQKLVETANHLSTFMKARGIGSLESLNPTEVRLFINARNKTGSQPALATRHLRRTNVRILLAGVRAAGHDVGDPTLDVELPSRSLHTTRPLTDEEVWLCRVASRPSPDPTRIAAAFALAEATATTGEIPRISVHDLDLTTGQIRLKGSRHTDPRIGSLTEWGVRILRAWVSGLPTRSLVAYQGTGRSLKGPQASASQLIKKTFDRAGLGNEPGVRSGSIGAWTARTVFDQTGDIASAARVLGARSLDTAARRIAWDWKRGTSQ